MNKHELIERYKTKYAEEPKDWKHPSVNASRQDLFANFIRDLEQLDELHKPVVPKFVADYIEDYKGGGATLFEMMDNSKGKVYTWLFGNPRIETENARQLLFAQAWLDGYEVEKLYEVIIGDLYLIKKFNDRNDFCFDTSRSLCTWEKYAYQLTEAEIKAIDERFWPFAVPVEEVAEG